MFCTRVASASEHSTVWRAANGRTEASERRAPAEGTRGSDPTEEPGPGTAALAWKSFLRTRSLGSSGRVPSGLPRPAPALRSQMVSFRRFLEHRLRAASLLQASLGEEPPARRWARVGGSARSHTAPGLCSAPLRPHPVSSDIDKAEVAVLAIGRVLSENPGSHVVKQMDRFSRLHSTGTPLNLNAKKSTLKGRNRKFFRFLETLRKY